MPRGSAFRKRLLIQMHIVGMHVGTTSRSSDARVLLTSMESGSEASHPAFHFDDTDVTSLFVIQRDLGGKLWEGIATRNGPYFPVTAVTGLIR
ncbi:uncharacterized protein I206_101336 [Kwoniella pini CBS 10737]|uniref:Uncharacterized protein n=1 Tax=Kwoniella pini CBS 10737 TaxID=1296096 RepID=A0AAJ8L139_9TREE